MTGIIPKGVYMSSVKKKFVRSFVQILYICTLCFIIHVRLRKKSNIRHCIGQFWKSKWEMSNASFLSKGIGKIPYNTRVNKIFIDFTKIWNRVLDWYKILQSWQFLILYSWTFYKYMYWPLTKFTTTFCIEASNLSLGCNPISAFIFSFFFTVTSNCNLWWTL